MYLQKYTGVVFIFVCAVKSMALVTDFHCKPKQGCQISQCDPIPFGHFDQGISKILERNEFPVICKAGDKLDKVLNQMTNSDAIEKQQEKNLKDSLLKELSEVIDEKLKSIKDSKVFDSKRLEEMIHRRNEEVRDLTKKNLEMQAKIQGLTTKAYGVSKRQQDMKLKDTLIKELSKIVDKKLEPIIGTRDLTRRMTEMDAKIQNLATKFYGTCDGLIYDGKCFWAEVHSTEDTNMNEAQAICRKKNSTLADVYSKVHYDALIKYLRTKLSGRSYINVWTGMTKLYRNPVARLSYGEPAPYTKQHSYVERWDEADEGLSHVYLHVLEEVTSSDQGMGAFWPTGVTHGALCQFGNIDFKRLEQGTRDLTTRMTEMDEKFQNLIYGMFNGLIYNGKRFWAEVHPNATINHAEAQAICQKNNLRLADIYSEVHYEMIIEYLKTKLDGKPSKYVWTGMKKLYKNPVAQLSNGDPAPYTAPRSAADKWDEAEEGRSHVYIQARSDEDNGDDQGMGAYWPTGNAHGALCQSSAQFVQILLPNVYELIKNLLT